MRRKLVFTGEAESQLESIRANPDIRHRKPMNIVPSRDYMEKFFLKLMRKIEPPEPIAFSFTMDRMNVMAESVVPS